MLIPQPGQLGPSHLLASVLIWLWFSFLFLFLVAQEKCPVNFKMVLISKPFDDTLCSSICDCASYKAARDADSLGNLLSPLCV